MSVNSIRRRQQTALPSGTRGISTVGGHGLLRPKLYNNPGRVEVEARVGGDYDEADSENRMLMVLPNELVISGVRVNDSFQRTRLEATEEVDPDDGTVTTNNRIELDELGLTVDRQDKEVSYEVRHNLPEVEEGVAPGLEVKVKPDFADFKVPATTVIRPPSFRVNAENPGGGTATELVDYLGNPIEPDISGPGKDDWITARIEARAAGASPSGLYKNPNYGFSGSSLVPNLQRPDSFEAANFNVFLPEGPTNPCDPYSNTHLAIEPLIGIQCNDPTHPYFSYENWLKFNPKTRRDYPDLYRTSLRPFSSRANTVTSVGTYSGDGLRVFASDPISSNHSFTVPPYKNFEGFSKLFSDNGSTNLLGGGPDIDTEIATHLPSYSLPSAPYQLYRARANYRLHTRSASHERDNNDDPIRYYRNIFLTRDITLSYGVPSHGIIRVTGASSLSRYQDFISFAGGDGESVRPFVMPYYVSSRNAWVVSYFQPVNIDSRVSSLPPSITVKVLQVRKTLPAELLGLGIEVNQYEQGTKRKTDSWEFPPELRQFSATIPVADGAAIDELGFVNKSGRIQLLSYDTKLPRDFNDTTQTAYVLRSGSGIENIGVLSKGSLLSVPSNTTVTEIPEHPYHEYLTFTGAWDGTSFKDGHSRCPVWILLWVLTHEKFGIELSLDDIDTQSFYDASVYNQEIVDGFPRWCFDGELNGTTKEIINTLLDSMGAALYQDDQARWVLSQERPQASSWIIAPHDIEEGRIAYRRALEKPGVRAKFINRLTGQEQTTKQLSVSDAIVDYAGQEAIHANRWAAWRSFTDKNLLHTIEITAPWVPNNIDKSVCNFYKVKLYDIIEIYDPLVSGQRISGRVLSSTDSEVTLDEPPLNLFKNGVYRAGKVEYKVYSDTKLLIQRPDGGVEKIGLKQFRFNPCDLRDNQWVFSSRRNPIQAGSIWAIETGRLEPQKYRVKSISESNDGLRFTITATPYYTGMHDHVEKGTRLDLPNAVWTGECGPNVEDFVGDAGEVNRNYPVKFTDIKTKKVGDWQVKWNEMTGLVDNLTSSC